MVWTVSVIHLVVWTVFSDPPRGVDSFSDPFRGVDSLSDPPRGVDSLGDPPRGVDSFSDVMWTVSVTYLVAWRASAEFECRRNRWSSGRRLRTISSRRGQERAAEAE